MISSRREEADENISRHTKYITSGNGNKQPNKDYELNKNVGVYDTTYTGNQNENANLWSEKRTPKKIGSHFFCNTTVSVVCFFITLSYMF